MSDLAIKIDHVFKEYRLGSIGGGTLRGDLQSWWARIRHQEDPNLKLGETRSTDGNQRFLALDDISLEVAPGETLGIIGHNGAGKSTLLKLLSRVTAPTKGTIGINGRIASMLEVGTGFHPELTGRENVYMNGAILGMSKTEITRKFDEIVEFAELAKFIDTPVKRYSSGMYVKLAFAVAAHLDSEILVMDEVLAVGDMKFQDKCLGKMGEVSSKEGRTVLYVSHNMSTVRRLCNRSIVLDHGKKIFDGDTNQAIDIYSGNSITPSLKQIFTKQKYWEFYSRKIQLLECEIINKDSPVYSNDEKVELRIKTRSDIDKGNIRIRAEYYNEIGGFLGFAISPILPTFSKNTEQIIKIKIDVSTLTNGKYQVDIGLFESNSSGYIEVIDLGKHAAHFSVCEKNDEENIIQNNKVVFGLNKFPKVQIESE